jgi:hypothetical protein
LQLLVKRMVLMFAGAVNAGLPDPLDQTAEKRIVVKLATQRRELPLPWGEGWGEGVRRECE